ncbi:MAG: transposase family protein [Candidatus Entotheonellia bacterium]
MHRPTAPEDQQDYYRGKKKCHTINNLLVIDETWQIGFLSATDDGKANDTRLADLEGYTFPPGSCLSQDLGFQGYTCDGLTIVQPTKKPPGGELTPPEKARNRAISSSSIRIEHAIGGVKRYRMGKDKIRLLTDGIRDTVMETCCGLHHFRLQYRPWHYASEYILKESIGASPLHGTTLNSRPVRLLLARSLKWILQSSKQSRKRPERLPG